MSEPSTPSFQGMCHYIGQLSKASKAGMRAALADCPKCHFNMLEGLLHAINCHGRDGAIYVSDLAREIRQPLPAVSRGLRLMEQDGTVVREPDPADRRKTLVRITPKGYELCHQCEQALRDYFASVLARLEPEQAAQMDALRGALMDAILAENAARNIDPKGETNHDKELLAAGPALGGLPCGVRAAVRAGVLRPCPAGLHQQDRGHRHPAGRH